MEEEINWEDFVKKEELRFDRSQYGKLGGRPKKKASDKKSKSIYIRVSEEEFALLGVSRRNGENSTLTI